MRPALDPRRIGTLGASEIAAVAGLSSHAGPLTIAARKRQQIADAPADSEAAEFGHWWELTAARWFEHRTGLHVLGEQTWVTSTARPWMSATIDGFVAETPDASMDELLGVWECKSFNVADGEDLAPAVMAQVLWQLEVCDLPTAWVTGLVGKSLQIRTIQRADHLDDIAWLIGVGEAFWQHILDGTDPPAAAGDLDMLKAITPEPDVVIDLDDETAELARLYRSQSAARNAAEKAADETKARLLQALGDAAQARHNGTTLVTRTVTSRTTTDLDALLVDHPHLAELMATYRRTTTYPRLTVKKDPR